VAKVYKDHGISGAKGRNGRPAFDTLCRDATKRVLRIVRIKSELEKDRFC
jgi:hypothetical protein